jgi:hypothetical protein
MSRGQRNGSPRSLVSVFLTGAATFPFKELLICPHEAEWTLLQTRCFSENLEAPETNPGPLDLRVHSNTPRPNAQRFEFELLVLRWPGRI